jgi:hypothetical protein
MSEFNERVAKTYNFSLADWHLQVGLTNGDIAILVHSIGTFVHEQIAPLKARISELEAAQREWKYLGVWEEGREYRAGNFCTDHGSIWHANTTTTSRPAVDHVSWTLAVKQGRPGRDANSAEPLLAERRLPTRPANRTG